MIRFLGRLCTATTLLATCTAWPVAAQQADPHAGHMEMSPDAPVDPHAHHHHGGGSPQSSPFEMADARFNALLTASTPMNGAVLDRTPPVLSLYFAKATTIRQIVLTNGAGQRVPVSTAPPLQPVGSFMSPLVRLDPGTYKLRWRGFDATGETGGTLAFTLQ